MKDTLEYMIDAERYEYVMTKYLCEFETKAETVRRRIETQHQYNDELNAWAVY